MFIWRGHFQLLCFLIWVDRFRCCLFVHCVRYPITKCSIASSLNTSHSRFACQEWNWSSEFASWFLYIFQWHHGFTKSNWQIKYLVKIKLNAFVDFEVALCLLCFEQGLFIQYKIAEDSKSTPLPLSSESDQHQKVIKTYISNFHHFKKARFNERIS